MLIEPHASGDAIHHDAKPAGGHSLLRHCPAAIHTTNRYGKRARPVLLAQRGRLGPTAPAASTGGQSGETPRAYAIATTAHRRGLLSQLDARCLRLFYHG